MKNQHRTLRHNQNSTTERQYLPGYIFSPPPVQKPSHAPRTTDLYGVLCAIVAVEMCTLPCTPERGKCSAVVRGDRDVIHETVYVVATKS